MVRRLRAVLAIAVLAAARAASAQVQVPPLADPNAVRVLTVASVHGAVKLQRSGRELAPQRDFLVFDGDEVRVGPQSRADLQLGRDGAIALVPGTDGRAALRFENLPFSSWAEDLDTRMRLEEGSLRVSRSRTGEASEWPVALLLDRWTAHMGDGEFLYRRDARGSTVCNVRGAVELREAPGSWHEALPPGRCVSLGTSPSPQRTELAAVDWSELQPGSSVVEAPPATVAVIDRSLEVAALPQVRPAPRGASPAPVVMPPSPPLVAAPEPLRVAAVASPALAFAPATAAVAVRPTLLAPPVLDVDPPRLALSGSLTRKPQATVAPALPPPMPAAVAPLAPPVAAQATPVAPVPAEPAPVPPAAAQAAPDEPVPDEPVPVEPVLVAPAAAETAIRVPTPPLTPVAPLPPPVSQRPLSGAAPPPLPDPRSPAAASFPVPRASGHPEWIVNVMTVADPGLANEHLAELIRHGNPALLRQEVVRGRASYRIVIGGIDSEQGARRTAQLLAGKGYPGAWPLQKR